MRYVSVFSGVEAATLAWHQLGWEPVAFSEIDPFPSAVLAERFPNVSNLGDITQIDWSEIGSVDLVVGGSPCQSFSVAGKREGLAGASGLMFEYIRCVRELRPRWFVWENVPGALSSEGGAAFGQLLGELDALGYGLAWRVLDAQFFGVAQRRQRLFVVGSLGEAGAERACEVLFEPDSLQWDPTPSREKRKELAARAAGGAGGAIPINTMNATRHKGRGTGFGVGDDGDPAYTVTAAHGHAVCAGFAAGSAGAPGRGGCVTIHQNQAGDAHVTRDLSGTLTAESSVSRQQLVFGEEPEGGAAEAATAIPINTMIATRGGKLGRGTGFGVAEDGDPAYTITATHPHAVCAGFGYKVSSGAGKVMVTYAIDRATTPKFSEELCHTLRRGGAGGCNDAVAVISQYGEVAGTLTARYDSSPCPDRGQSIVNDRSVVRRLTPRECERLQGMPDDWTRIPYRGKSAEDCPDGPRYKAIGNSMAVPVMRWIGERIAMADKVDGTD